MNFPTTEVLDVKEDVVLELLRKLLENRYSIPETIYNRPHRKICVTMLRYNVEKPETSYVQVRLFGRKEDEEKVNQNVFVNCKLDILIFLLDITNSVYDKVIASEPPCNVL